MHRKLARTAGTTLFGIVALCLGSAPAALASPAQNPHYIPCRTSALAAAISTASGTETLILAPGCTYVLREGLPTVTTTLTIVGNHSTLERSDAPGTPSFSILMVEDSGDLTVVGVDFTNGGGDSNYGGGAIRNGGTTTVRGGTFRDNKNVEHGGAIYSDGTLTVSDGAIFTGNVSVYGGAIDSENTATISGSSFTWNKALALFGGPDNAYGGAIYNDGSLDLTDSGFLANSSDGYGGAIYNDDTLTARHITVTANAAGYEGGGIYNDDETVTLTDSTLFGNHPDNCYPVGTIADCIG
jgi:predicted outer membrane repeat protein